MCHATFSIILKNIFDITHIELSGAPRFFFQIQFDSVKHQSGHYNNIFLLFLTRLIRLCFEVSELASMEIFFKKHPKTEFCPNWLSQYGRKLLEKFEGEEKTHAHRPCPLR